MEPLASGVYNHSHILAFLTGAKDSLLRVDPGVVLVQFPDFAPAEALIYLAEQNNVLGYRGFTLATTDEQKRDLIKNARYLNRIAGTPFAIKRAILAVGFDSVVIREHTGLLHDGSFNHDGSHYHVGGSWYNFSVQVFYSGTAPDSERRDLVSKLIDEWKNERSVLTDLTFTLTA